MGRVYSKYKSSDGDKMGRGGVGAKLQFLKLSEQNIPQVTKARPAILFVTFHSPSNQSKNLGNKYEYGKYQLYCVIVPRPVLVSSDIG